MMKTKLGQAAVASLLVYASPAFAADVASPVQPAAASPFGSMVEGDTFLTRLYHSYADEFGKATPVSDPNAPPSRRPESVMAPAPETSPPYPFVDWPVGGVSTIGATLPNSVDTPLQSALLPPTTTSAGKFLYDHHIQIYGWVDVSANASSAKTGYAGNNPAAYDYTPNIAQLDQAVVYIERLPDTVQQDHVDWGFRVSGIYGENYRYTTALGVFSNQYVIHNHFAGYDMPMVYGEVYLPYFAEGVVVRVGRYISLPDIEAQLAPNNYTYTHSLMYTFDNYTNTGAVVTTKINRQLQVQLSVSGGTETVPWNAKHIDLINPNTGGQGYSGKRDPGAQPSATVCVQYQSVSGKDQFQPCFNSINNGNWGYNNLQWYGFTYYHKFTDKLHLSFETYYEYENNVPDVSTGYGGTAFAYDVNPPLEAHCPFGELKCVARAFGALAYLNYEITPLDNITGRAEFYDDAEGQRTGYATKYTEETLGYQHWFSPSIELRPEIAFYQSYNQAAFDNGTKHNLTLFSTDLILHF